MMAAWSLVLGFLRLIDRLLVGRGVLFIQKCLQSPHLWTSILSQDSQLLILKVVWTRTSWFELEEKCSFLSNGFRRAVNVVDLFPRRNRRVQVLIWLGGKGAHKRLHPCSSHRLIYSEFEWIRTPPEILDKTTCRMINIGLDGHASRFQGGRKTDHLVILKLDKIVSIYISIGRYLKRWFA